MSCMGGSGYLRAREIVFNQPGTRQHNQSRCFYVFIYLLIDDFYNQLSYLIYYLFIYLI